MARIKVMEMVSRFNVLVVDDDPDKLHLLELALSMAGYDVRTARDGEEALAAIQSFQPDLIVTDVMMPRMNGYDLVHKIRSDPKTKFIPVILQTAARHDAEDLRRGSEVGALGYITDPSDLNLLLARARTLLDFKSYLDSCEEAAFTDHLSGLANRRRFERQLDREVARTRRYKRAFSLAIVDIDHFKIINDTYGHEAGDQVIQLVAKTLQEGTRGIDLAARIGGDEFGLIFSETALESACQVADRLWKTIKELTGPQSCRFTASFGVAESPSCGQTSRELLACADNALYEAKRAGRDGVHVATARTLQP